MGASLIALALVVTSPRHETGNVLWIVLDDISNEYVNVYGEGPRATQPPTPEIDALAAEGLRFNNFYVNPVCSPTRITLLTGEYAWRSGIGAVDRFNEVPMEMVTLPEALDREPSVLVGIWKLGGDHRWGDLEPIVHGYWLYAGDPSTNGDYFDWTRTTSWRWGAICQDFTTYQTSQNVDDVLQAIAALPVPWHIAFNMHSVHKPFHHPPPHLHSQGKAMDDQGKYMAMVEAADTEIGRLLSSVDLETTTVFLLSDNGTDSGLSHPRRTGKATTFEGGVNCPLIVAGRLVQPGVTNALANSVDLYETTLDLMGRSGQVDPLDGVSLFPVLQDPTTTVRDWVYGERFAKDPSELDHRYARDERYKLRTDWNSGKEWFYDLWMATPGQDGPPLDLSRLTTEQRTHLDGLREVVATPER